MGAKSYVYVGELNENTTPVGTIKERNLIAGLRRHFGERVSVVANGTPRLTSRAYFVIKDVLVLPWLLLSQIVRHRRRGWNPVIIANAPFFTTMLPAVLLARLLRIPLVGSLDQGPYIPEYPSWVNKLDVWLVRRCDALLTYVAQSAIDFLPGRPFLEILYAVDDETMNLYSQPHVRRNERFTICYTGNISAVYNIDILSEVIRATDKRYRWVFAGQGMPQYEDLLRDLASDPNLDVSFLGRVGHDEAVRLQLQADLLLCLKGGVDNRATNFHYYENYAASGKLIEYLCSGTPVLAGDIPAFSDQLKPFMTCLKRQTPQTIIAAIESIIEDYPAKLALAASGQEFAKTHGTAEYQNQRICDFVEQHSLIASQR